MKLPKSKVQSVKVELAFQSNESESLSNVINLHMHMQDKDAAAKTIEDIATGKQSIASMNFIVKSVTKHQFSASQLLDGSYHANKINAQRKRAEQGEIYKKQYEEFYINNNPECETSNESINVNFDNYVFESSDNVWGMWTLNDFKNLFKIDPVRCINEFFKYNTFTTRIHHYNKLKACLDNGTITLEYIHKLATLEKDLKIFGYPSYCSINQILLTVRTPKMWKNYTIKLAW